MDGELVIDAYVDGAGLDEVHDQFASALGVFVASRDWSFDDVWIVDQQETSDATLHPGDQPQWDLGLNLACSRAEIPTRKAALEADLLELARFLNELIRQGGRGFVLGVDDDLVHLEGGPVEPSILALLLSE